MSENRVIEPQEQSTDVKRKLSLKRIVIFSVGTLLVIAIMIIAITSLGKSEATGNRKGKIQSEGTFIAGIPFSDILAKVSVEIEPYSGMIIPAGAAEKAIVEVNKTGDLKVNYPLSVGEALIFDRDGLALESKKKADDFIIGSYATENISISKNDSNVLYCEDAESIARVLRYNYDSQQMVLLWENDLFYDQFLPVTAISNIAKFDIEKTKPMAGNIYDESKVLVEVEKDSTINHFGLDDGLDTYQVAIIQTGKENFAVMSQNYIDTDITVEGPNHYIIDRNISRILIYDYDKNLIELVYQRN